MGRSRDTSIQHVRTFAKFFTNLTPDQQREFERALVSVQDSIDTTSLGVTIDLLERKPNQSLPIPVLTITRSIRGALISWAQLPDQRINFFEVQVTSTSNFAVASTVTTYGNQATISGITTTKYIRVRGVRKDGTTTPYSEIGSVTPRIFDVRIKFQETFYVSIPKSATPPTNCPFYPVGRIKFTPVDPDAQTMAIGFVTLFADPNVNVYGLDDIRIRLIARTINGFYVNGMPNVEDTATYWQSSCGEFFGSYSVGPIPIEHPTLGKTLEVELGVQDGTQHTTNHPTKVHWAWLSTYEVGLD